MVLTSTGRFKKSPGICAGKQEIEILIRKLSNRYAGTIIISHPRGEVRGLQEWINYFQSFKRPVAWLDRAAKSDTHHHQIPNLIRGQISEKRILQKTLDYIVSTGHRNILYTYLHTMSWAKIRGKSLKKRKENKQTRFTISFFFNILS